MVAFEEAVEKANTCAGRSLRMNTSGLSPERSRRISISVPNRWMNSAAVSVST